MVQALLFWECLVMVQCPACWLSIAQADEYVKQALARFLLKEPACALPGNISSSGQQKHFARLLLETSRCAWFPEPTWRTGTGGPGRCGAGSRCFLGGCLGQDMAGGASCPVPASLSMRGSYSQTLTSLCLTLPVIS